MCMHIANRTCELDTDEVYGVKVLDEMEIREIVKGSRTRKITVL